MAQAALPSVFDLGRVQPTPSGVVDTRYRDGDDGTAAIPLSWGTCPTITLTDGGACTTNLRTVCTLVEAGTPTSTLSLLSGTLPSGCSISGDGITGTVSAAGSGSIVVRATRNSDTADTAAFTVQALAGGSDSTAPTIPLGLTGTDNADGTGTLTWDGSSDPVVSSVVTGVASYRVQLGGSTVTTVTAPSSNIQPTLTQQIVGSSDGTPSSTQTGADWALSFGGAGLLSTSDNVLARWALVTGDYTATAKVTAYTPVSGTTGSIGIAARASSAAGSIGVFSRWRDSDDKCTSRHRATLDGAASTGSLSSALTLPVWVKQVRAGDVFSTYCSSDGNTWTLTSSHTISPGTAVYVGPFITSGTAGVNATGTVAQFNIQQGGTVSYVYTGAGGSFTVSSYDGTNRSSESAAVTLTPTGGASGGGDITVPAATHTVCNSGCDYTPSQLSTVAISQRVAGDVLELRAATAGGSEEWAARISCNAVSGTSGSPIYVAVRDGDTIRLDTTTASGVGLIDMTDCDYWNFVGSRDGASTGFVIGDETWHQAACAQGLSGSYLCYPNNRAVMVRSSTGVAFVGMSIRGGNNYTASLIDENSTKILLKNLDIGYHGHNAYDLNNNDVIDSTGEPTGDSDTGDIMEVCATNVVVEDVYMHHSGHTTPIPCGPYQVYRRIKADGNWLDRTTTTQYSGNHAFTAVPALNRSQYNTATRFGPLVEDSLFYNAGSEPSHKNFQEAVQAIGVNIIWRGNYSAQRSGSYAYGHFGIQWMNMCATGNSETAANLRIAYLHAYHNTSWGGSVTDNSGSFGGVTTGLNADNCAQFKIKNNLFQGIQRGPVRSSTSEYAVRWQAPAAYTGYSNGWKGAEWFGNVFGQHPTDPSSATLYQVSMATYTGGSGGGTTSLTNGVDANGDYDCGDGGDSGTWPSNWCGNLSAQLSWASGTATALTNTFSTTIDGDTLRAALTLAPSATYGLGDAWPLTTTTDAGTADTTLTLADARYFYDGWDNEDYDWDGLKTETGDCICVGPTASSTAAQCVVTQIQVDSLNYSTGAVTVSPGVNHEAGSRVWWAAKSDAGVCGAVVDNRGAAQ